MYKVFIKDVAILVTTDRDSYPDYQQFSLKKIDFTNLIQEIETGHLSKVLLYAKSERKLLKRLHKKLPLVKAAGGMAINSRNEYLFIHRNGKWDLPKGKKERLESMKMAAIREVEEETGVKNLKITHQLGRTYHVYNWNAKLKLKLTKWYIMETDYDGKLKPQKKEGIDKAVWLTKKKAILALQSSYANIKELFPDGMLSTYER